MLHRGQSPTSHCLSCSIVVGPLGHPRQLPYVTQCRATIPLSFPSQSPGTPGTSWTGPAGLPAEGQWDYDTWDLSGMSQGSRDSGMGRTMGLWPSSTWDLSGISRGSRGLWDRKDSGIMPYTVVRDIPGSRDCDCLGSV